MGAQGRVPSPWRGRLVVVLLVLGASVAIASALPGLVDRVANGRRHDPPYAVGEEAAARHAAAVVVDLHADSLLWGRDLTRAGETGHVDLPRLRQGGVALQVFSVVTKSPRDMNVEATRADTLDLITLLAVTDGWPAETWTSLRARALFQAGRLATMTSPTGLVPVRSRADLDALLGRRSRGEPVVGALLALEGGHPLEGRLEVLDELFEAGVRMLGLTHFFDNALGGSAHGMQKGGLTPLGEQVVDRAGALGVVLDLAHASPRLVQDVLARSRDPVVVSHTGVRATCESPRNLDDEQLRAVARQGGVVGIGFWEMAVCDLDVDAIADAIVHAVAIAGPDHVSLGSDFDGLVRTPFDARGLPLVTEALMARGLEDDVIGRVLGGNALRVLRAVLPEGD